jgi:hypothetical protein
MPNNFANQVGGVSIDFNAIPDLQPKAIRGIIKLQSLPEENVLRDAISTVPVADKLFKARIDDAINLDMTPEVNQNSDDPMVGDKWRWKSDQVHEYRQACKINRELGQQLLAPDGSPTKYAGQAELQRLIGRVTTALDNRREYNRAMSVINAHGFDPSRTADLDITNILNVSESADKWDSQSKDAQGNLVCQPFGQIGASANRLAFLSGKVPTSLIVTPDVVTALENWNSFMKSSELTAPKAKGARYTCRNLQLYVSQGRKNIGTDDAPRIVPLFQNLAVICSLDEDTIAENQYDINRVEQFTTSDQLFYYVRYWHKSKVHVSRPINFFFIENVLATAYDFQNVSSLFY